MALAVSCTLMRPALAFTLAALLVGGGCAANSYQIPKQDLARLAETPPEVRGQRVRVIQEISETSVQPADRIDGNTDVIIAPNFQIGGGVRVNARGGGGGGVGGAVRGAKLGGAANDSKGAAIALLVLAATALVAVAAVEGSRFDGWTQLHPMHPVHLVGPDGLQETVPLAWVDRQAVAWADKAIVRPDEGPWRPLERAPLTRTGFGYSMYGGAGSLRSTLGDRELGPAFVLQLGYHPVNEIGVLASVFFGWRDNQLGETLFEGRYALEVQALPIVLGPLHAGVYGQLGRGHRFEDGVDGSGNASTSVFGAGTMIQLDVHTRIALTARMGLARAHGERMTEMLLGLSVY